MVQQPVEDGGSDHGVPEELLPVREALVGRDDRRASLIAVRHELEEEVSLLADHRDVADFIDDYQVREGKQGDAHENMRLFCESAARGKETHEIMGVPLFLESLRGGYVTLGILLGIPSIFAVYIALEQKRHVEFYRDERRGEKLLRVVQDTKMQLLNATYTVTDAAGNSIGTFSKNYLWDIIFKRWECRDPRGRLLFKVREDSVIKAILRRLFGTLLGLLRVGFVFCDPISGEEMGRFNRSFTLLDRYVLDMKNDRTRRIDRRLALAMGVMLDTGEKR